MAQLEHPHILPFLDGGENDKALWYVTQLAKGGAAGSWLDQQPDSERTKLACTAVAQVLSALGYAHAAGIVHRDVKPANIMVMTHSLFKLGDFGAARYRQHPLDLTITGDALGTVAYTAPEQELDPRQATATSDIYGAGASLYRLCQGHPGAPPLLHLVELTPQQHPHLSHDLLQLIQRSTRLAPEERYPSAHDMARALHDVLSTLD